MSCTSAPRIKREPEAGSSTGTQSVSTTSSSTSNSIVTNPSVHVIVKPEPAHSGSDKEDDQDEDEPLPQPDPDKPKKYRRIRKVNDEENSSGCDSALDADKSSPDKTAKTSIKRKAESSSSEDEYVPLCADVPITVSSTDKESDDSGTAMQNKRSRPPRSKRRRPARKVPAAPRRRGVRTRRQKAEESPSSEPESSSTDTKSLNGFLVSDSAESSEPEESESLSERETRRSTRRQKNSQQSSSQSTRKTRAATKPSKVSGDEDSSDLFDPTPPKSTSSKSKNSKRKQSSSSSSGSSSSDDYRSPTKRSEPLSNDIASELRGFLPTKGLTSRKRHQCGKNNLIMDGRLSGHDEGDSDDSFIDNKPSQTWNLESSSSSDEEKVVQEDAGVLDMNSDNYEPASDSTPSEDEDNYKSESSGSSEGDGVIPVEVIHLEVEAKCALCENLANIDFRGRDIGVEADWCRCGRCKIFSPKMLNYDRVCCQEIKKICDFIKSDKQNNKCITQHPRFDTEVLEYGAVLKSLKNRKGSKRKSKILAEFRTATDKEKVIKCKDCFLKWIFNKMGMSHSMVVPACVVQRIRKKYAPSAGPLYFDAYKVNKLCQYGKHCRRAKTGV